VAAQRRVAITRTRFSTRGPKAQRGTVLRFRLRRPGTVELVVRSGCEVVGQRRVHGRGGVNRVPFRGRVHGHPLSPGRYTVTVVVVRGGARTRVGTVAIEVVPPTRHLTRAERSAPVLAGCVATTSPGSAVLTSLVAPLSTRSSSGVGKPAKPKANVPRRTGVLGASFKPPLLPPVIADAGARLGWLGLVIYFLLGAAGAAIVIYVARFFRGSWDP
jgi:hypothetical protein